MSPKQLVKHSFPCIELEKRGLASPAVSAAVKNLYFIALFLDLEKSKVLCIPAASHLKCKQMREESSVSCCEASGAGGN